MEIDFEIEKIIELLKNKKYKKVLLQFPDGLKPYSKYVYDIVKQYADEVYIWFESNYGGCDIPIWVEKYGIELIVHFGHTKFYKLKYE